MLRSATPQTNRKKEQLLTAKTLSHGRSAGPSPRYLVVDSACCFSSIKYLSGVSDGALHAALYGHNNPGSLIITRVFFNEKLSITGPHLIDAAVNP